MWNNKLYLLSAASLLASTTIPVAQAQGEGNRLALEEVIVTAQKREESLQDAPISIAAFSQEALEQQGISAVDDLQGKVPGLNLTPFPTQSTSLRMFIRGVGAGDIQVTQDPAIGVYIDQVYIGRSTGLAFELADLAQVEVLRGAQGTLFGRNSIGGAINMTTIKPEVGVLDFKQELGTGRRNLFRSKTSVNIPLTESLAVRGVYMYKKKDGYVNNAGVGRDFLDSKDKGGKLDFLWEPDEDWSVRYAFDYARSEFVSPTFQAIEGAVGSEFFEIPVSSDLIDTLATKDEMQPSDTNIDGHSLTITREWDTYTVKSITAYREFEYFQFTNLESGSPSESLFLNDNAGIALVGHRPRLRQDQLSQEFQLLVDASDSLNWVAGLYYFDEDATKVGGTGSTVIVPQPDEINNFDIENEAWAIYGQGNWTPQILDSRLTITAGIRYTEDDRFAARDFTLDPDPEGRSFSSEPSASFDNVSYTLVANYAIDDDINTYVKLATGYKSGGYNIRASTLASYEPGFNEEEITTWEWGLKSELWDRRVRLNAAAYFSVWEDMQLNLNDPTTPNDVRDTNVFNAGEADLGGVEIDLTAILSEGLTASLAYAYQDAEFTEVVDPGDPDVSEDDFGITNAPEHQYTLGLNYFLPLSFGAFNASVNYNWVDDRADSQRAHEIEDGTGLIDSYGLLGAHISLSEISCGSSGSLTVALWGRNLTDEEYSTTNPPVLQAVPPPFTPYTKIAVFGEPLSYGLDVTYRFSN